ncbi:MAG: ribonuclease HII [Bryobacteraceae bacterium]|nr:ribonuclease HII [Bryobacteraceae bacterium]MDW8379708.1 ribonuclease HII [Bryobacterales bacterium]
MGAKAHPKSWQTATLRSTFERNARRRGFQRIAGVDEAGRGALFGPVFAAAVILDPAKPIRGLRDSKQLDAPRREILALRIRERALAWAVAAVEAEEIDRVNIYQASRIAMERAILRLHPPADYLLLDAMRVTLSLPQQGIVHGDALCPTIAAASILAKVERDACMQAWDAVYPQYGFAQHKGYPTADHLRALEIHGPTPHHRKTYSPVRQRSLFAFPATGEVCP